MSIFHIPFILIRPVTKHSYRQSGTNIWAWTKKVNLPRGKASDQKSGGGKGWQLVCERPDILKALNSLSPWAFPVGSDRGGGFYPPLWAGLESKFPCWVFLLRCLWPRRRLPQESPPIFSSSSTPCRQQPSHIPLLISSLVAELAWQIDRLNVESKKTKWEG